MSSRWTQKDTEHESLLFSKSSLATERPLEYCIYFNKLAAQKSNNMSFFKIGYNIAMDIYSKDAVLEIQNKAKSTMLLRLGLRQIQGRLLLFL